jgi:DnaA regulatory inactivator Hda
MNPTIISTVQFPLALDTQLQPGFDLFIAGENVEAYENVLLLAGGGLKSNLYLWGSPGNGVTHLLQAACRHASEQGRQVAYIPFREHAALNPGMLENLEVLDLVCVDDIDLVGGQSAWEQALFHLYNHRRDHEHAMLIGAHTAPQSLNFILPDLKSRMAWDLVYHLKTLPDADKIVLLQQRAKSSAFDLPLDVAGYLVRRVQRDLPTLIALLEQLQHAMLAEQRKLTVPFVKSILDKGL